MAELEQRRAGSGESLLAVHGIGSCWQVWEPILEPLEARFDVLALSLPGYGSSPPLDELPTVPALVDAVERTLDAAGLDTVHVAGNSLGGWIAAELAVRGRALSVTAISPAGLWTDKEFAYSYRLLRLAYTLAQRVRPLAPRLARSAAGRRLLFGLAAAHAERMTPSSAELQLAALAGSPSFRQTLDWIADGPKGATGIEAIACPFTLVWGTADLILPYRQAARWERVVPDARLMTLKGAGHVPMVDEPDACVTAIEQTAQSARAAEAVGAEPG